MDKLLKTKQSGFDLRVMIWDAMTHHDVTEIYNLIHILKMQIEILPRVHMESTVHIRAP